jgi:hypothetical protein
MLHALARQLPARAHQPQDTQAHGSSFVLIWCKILQTSDFSSGLTLIFRGGFWEFGASRPAYQGVLAMKSQSVSAFRG